MPIDVSFIHWYVSPVARRPEEAVHRLSREQRGAWGWAEVGEIRRTRSQHLTFFVIEEANMAKILSMVFLCYWAFTGLAFAQNFSRQYTLSSQGTALTLTLQQEQGTQLLASSSPPSGTGGSVVLSKDVVSDPQWGYRFALPKGWKVEKGPKGAILGHDTIAGLIWVFPHSASTLQEVQRQMQAGLDEEDVQLRLTSQLQSLGKNAVTGIFSGTFQRQPVKARGIGTFLPNGGGAYIVAMTSPNKFGSDLENAADAVAKSMQSVKAQESAKAGGTGAAGTSSGSGNQQLMQQMAGSYYSFSSAGPYSSGGTERRVTLCPNGTYYSGSESGYSGGAGTGGAWGSASQQSGRGTWRVQGNVNQGILTTIDSSGKPTEYRYQRCGGDCIYIGNTKFAVAGPANCP
jgi:hypothetical protein